MQEDGAGFAGFATWLDMTPAHPDMLAVPDPSSVIQLPWKPEVAWVAANCVMEGEDVAQAPRNVLRRLIDEAASRLRMQIDSKPEELDELDRRVVQLKIERAALTKETDEMSRERLARLETELGTLEEDLSNLSARWQAEKNKLADSQKTQEALEAARLELEQVFMKIKMAEK